MAFFWRKALVMGASPDYKHSSSSYQQMSQQWQ